MFQKQEDTYSYKGWLQSDFIVKRAFAVLGHYLLAGIIIWLISMTVFLLGGLLLGFSIYS